MNYCQDGHSCSISFSANIATSWRYVPCDFFARTENIMRRKFRGLLLKNNRQLLPPQKAVPRKTLDWGGKRGGSIPNAH